MEVNELILTGRSQSHLTLIDEKIFVHQEMKSSFYALKEKAKGEGFDLKIVSGFRSFERQKKIWNLKASGKRDLLDERGEKLDYNQLSPSEIIFSILRWSAFPGASRHHWGSDIDVIDQNSLPKDYSVQLTPSEVSPEGIFGKLHLWLDELISKNEANGFYRPYAEDLGGVCPEKWHLSYSPISENFLNEYTFEFFENFINSYDCQDIELIDVVKDHAKDIFDKYIVNVKRS